MTDKPAAPRPVTVILQRLLGAVILISVAALLVPLLLDGQGLRQAQDRPVIPDEPAFDVRLGDSGEPEVRLLDVKGEVVRELPEPDQPVQAPDVSDPGQAQPAAAVSVVASPVNASKAGAGTAPASTAAAAPSHHRPEALKPVPAPAKTARPDITPPPVVAAPQTGQTDPGTSTQAEGVSVAWMLQMGAFKDKANAQKTVALLQAKGFRATLNSRNAGVFKVQVGPEIRRDRAEALRQRVAQATGMQGVLVRFQP